MEKVKCPLCKASCVTVPDCDAFGGSALPVLQWHTVLRAPEAGNIRAGARVAVGDGAVCLGWGLRPDFAEGVAADIRAGIQSRAHP